MNENFAVNIEILNSKKTEEVFGIIDKIFQNVFYEKVVKKN